MEMAGEEEEEETKKVVFRSWDCGSPLYDSFELASVCPVLDNNLRVVREQPDSVAVLDKMERAPARRKAAKAKRWRRRKAVAAAAAARRTGKAVLHSICRSVTCSGNFHVLES